MTTIHIIAGSDFSGELDTTQEQIARYRSLLKEFGVQNLDACMEPLIELGKGKPTEELVRLLFYIARDNLSLIPVYDKKDSERMASAMRSESDLNLPSRSISEVVSELDQRLISQFGSRVEPLDATGIVPSPLAKIVINEGRKEDAYLAIVTASPETIRALTEQKVRLILEALEFPLEKFLGVRQIEKKSKALLAYFIEKFGNSIEIKIHTNSSATQRALSLENQLV